MGRGQGMELCSLKRKKLMIFLPSSLYCSCPTSVVISTYRFFSPRKKLLPGLKVALGGRDGVNRANQNKTCCRMCFFLHLNFCFTGLSENKWTHANRNLWFSLFLGISSLSSSTGRVILGKREVAVLAHAEILCGIQAIGLDPKSLLHSEIFLQ